VRNSIFAGQCWAAIVNYKGVNNLYDTTGNDYSRLRAGAVPVSIRTDRPLIGQLASICRVRGAA